MLKVTFMSKTGVTKRLHKSGKISKVKEFNKVLSTLWKQLCNPEVTMVQVTFTKSK